MKSYAVDGKIYYGCPGCAALNSPYVDGFHIIPVNGEKAWGFNGDFDRPTLTPSVNETCEFGISEMPTLRCHHFLRDGRIEYLSDCSHPLAGQTVDLPEISNDGGLPRMETK